MVGFVIHQDRYMLTADRCWFWRKFISHKKYKNKIYEINKKVEQKSFSKNHKDYAEFFSNHNLVKFSFLNLKWLKLFKMVS